MGVGAITAIVFLILFVMLIVRAPVALALVVSGAYGVYLLRGFEPAMGTLANVPFASTARYTLLVIPMFVLMGAFARHAGIAEESFAWISHHTRRLPGGIALAALASCAAFAAISGSSVATVATVGRVSLQEMRRYGYDMRFAAGVIAASGTLGVLIPPSIILVLYGIITGENIGRLLIAGFVPGLLSAMGYGAAILIRARRDPALVGHSKVESASAAAVAAADGGGEAQDELANVRTAWARGDEGDDDSNDGRAGATALVRIAVLAIAVIGGLYAGVFTATEASVIGAALAGVMMLVRFIGRPGLRDATMDAFREATNTTAMIMALLIGASVFTAFLATARVPAMFTDWVLGLDVSPTVVVVLVLLAFVPLGMFLEGISLLIIAVPLAYPIVTALGFDGLWFGILVVKMIEVGLITPPVGLNAYVVAGVSDDLRVVDVFRGIGWFIPVDIVTIVVLFAFPALILWLPGLM